MIEIYDVTLILCCGQVDTSPDFGQHSSPGAALMSLEKTFYNCLTPSR